jgi:hypothetical protein
MINAASNTFGKEIPALALLPDPPPCLVAYVDGIQHPAGLLNVMHAGGHLGCQSVFNKLGWVCHSLSATKFLWAYNIPLHMNAPLVADNHTRGVLVWGLSLLVITSIFCATWSKKQGGGSTGGKGPVLAGGFAVI